MADSEFTSFMEIDDESVEETYEEFGEESADDYEENFEENFEDIYSNILEETLLADDYENNIDWNDEDFPHTETSLITEETISNKKRSTELTPCVIVDLIEGEVKRCNSTDQLRPLYNMLGIWEIDTNDPTIENKTNCNQLGACHHHIFWDQNSIHPHLKSDVPLNNKEIPNMVQIHLCLFCRKKKSFFSRETGTGCRRHSWCMKEYNFQTPCIGATCVLTDASIAEKTSSNYRAHYICTTCFQKQGGHFYTPPGRGRHFEACGKRGEHNEDMSIALEDLGKWVASRGSIKNTRLQKRLISILVAEIINHKNDRTADIDSSPDTEWPSTLLVRAALKLGEVDISHDKITEKASIMGKDLGRKILSLHSGLEKNRKQLEDPSTCEEYSNALPSMLCEFFQALITTLQERKQAIINKKRKQRGQSETSINTDQIKRTTMLFVSMLLTIAFPGIRFWLSYIMSSLCQKPKLLPYLRKILYTAKVVSYSKRHENRLEVERALNADPKSKILQGTQKMFNLAVIDNIDFAALTFKSGNIFDTPRQTSHATLRLLVQFTLPDEADDIVIMEDSNNPLFGESLFTSDLLTKFETIVTEMSKKEFNLEHLHSEIADIVPLGCKNIGEPNIVILEPGKPPSCNENVHAACEMYRDDLQIGSNENMYIACDQAIFARLIPYKKKHKDVRLILGQWHTSKAMLSTLIKIFSGYGIFHLAGALGVQYLDKFENVVDYRVASYVMELIWGSVGVALCKYQENRGRTMGEILNGDNQVMKVWYLFFHWAGYFVGHKVGIRRGNYKMQMENLAAFAPLFSAAGKFRYASSVAHFLVQVRDDPQLQKLLQMVCSVNLTREGHYLAFDETIEVYGVKFIKQNISGNLVHQETLDLKITAAQSEWERLLEVINAFAGDIVGNRNPSSHIKSLHNNAAQSMILALVFTFGYYDSNPNPSPNINITTPNLFKGAPELNEKGFRKLSLLIDVGKLRFQTILDEDVFGISQQTIGRKKINVNTYTSAELKAMQKQERVLVSADQSAMTTSDQFKQIRRKTTEGEKAILSQLFQYSDTLPDTAVENIKLQLPTWTSDRIKQYWRNNRSKNDQ
jgi:hypothetical protein